MLYFLRELEHFKEFDVENKGGEGWNAIACTVFSIGEVVGEVEAVFGTFFHKLYAFGPTGDDLVESKVGGLVPLVGTVEDCSINEGSVVVAAYGVSSLGAATGAFGEYFVLQAAWSRAFSQLIFMGLPPNRKNFSLRKEILFF